MEDTNERYTERAVKHRKNRRKPKRQIRPGCLISVVALLFAFIILFLTPIFSIKQVVCEGNSTIKSQDIIAASGIEINKNIFSTNLGEATKKVLQVPYVESVKITRQLPGTVKIAVVEGKVSAYLKWDKKFVGINEKGQTLCVVNKVSATRKAPVVKGITIKEACVVGQAVVVNQTSRFETLMKFMKTFNEKGMTADITVFDITEADYISIMHRDKLKIEFGNTKDYDHKFSFVDALLESMGKDVEGELNMISENYTYGHTVQ
ncbi:MAG: FtsQ-type POTRA domain-containing protein [Clostridia bacterium]|nr:FtsQ-type POTRA domain-containing protein [Clostridia bacterium]